MFPGQEDFLFYNITTLWNGTAVDHEEFVSVSLSVDDASQDLVVTFSGPFWNNLTPEDRPALQNDTHCPTRPYNELWKYEVAEIFFLNDEDEYLEIEINPQGKYLLILLDGYRTTRLSLLPLFPDGVEWENDCYALQQDCRWTSSAIIPKRYMPANVNKFNAYAIHHDCRDEPVYESLFPVDPVEDNVTRPDFHYLPAFEPISLSSIGYAQSGDKSQLWSSATDENGEHDYVFEYALELQGDCGTSLKGDQYEARVTTTKRARYENFVVYFSLKEEAEVEYAIPDEVATAGPTDKLDTTSESFWLIYTSANRQRLRIGVNPEGAYRVTLIDSDQIVVSDGVELESAVCSRCQNCDFECTLTVPWELLPANVTNYQMAHAHYPENGANSTDDFFSVLCPGLEVGSTDPYDMTGCETDVTGVAMQRSQHSYFWMQALDITTTTTTTTTTATTTTTTTSKGAKKAAYSGLTAALLMTFIYMYK